MIDCPSARGYSWTGGVVPAGSQSGRFEAVVTLQPAPAVVLAAPNEIDLFPGVLADVPRKEAARRGVEAHAPGVAQAVRPDLRPRGTEGPAGRAARRERVVGGHGVLESRIATVDVDAQDAAEERLGPLRVILRITGRTAVADGDVQVSVRPEVEVASIVVAEGLLELEQHPLARRIRDGRPPAREASELAEPRPRRVLAGGEDVEEPVLGMVRMKRESEQAEFAVRPRLDTQEDVGGIGVLVRLEGQDQAALLGHEQTAFTRTGVPEPHRRREIERRERFGDRQGTRRGGRGEATGPVLDAR
jgi:hypothetical protein